MPNVNIEVLKDGPVLVTGPISLKNSAGAEIPVEKDTIALCRCGHSAAKPFCDGAHKRQGFQAN
jgi:CDGSH-type Zn-finger protein